MYIYVQIFKSNDCRSKSRNIKTVSRVFIRSDTCLEVEANGVTFIISVNEETDIDVLFVNKTEIVDTQLLEDDSIYELNFVDKLRYIMFAFKRHQPTGIANAAYNILLLNFYYICSQYDEFLSALEKVYPQYCQKYRPYIAYYNDVRRSYYDEIIDGSFFKQPLGPKHYIKFMKRMVESYGI